MGNGRSSTGLQKKVERSLVEYNGPFFERSDYATWHLSAIRAIRSLGGALEA